MNKIYLSFVGGAIFTLVLTGAGCKSSISTDKSADEKGVETATEVTTETNKIKIETTEDKPGQEKKQPEPVVYESQLREFTVSAKNWEFNPSTMIVNQGDRVKIKITSTDVNHSFMLKDYDINVKLEPNKTQVIEFVATKFGVFPFRCAVPCGEGHRDMTGTLVVK